MLSSKITTWNVRFLNRTEGETLIRRLLSSQRWPELVVNSTGFRTIEKFVASLRQLVDSDDSLQALDRDGVALRQGWTMQQVQALMGHSSETMTKVYLEGHEARCSRLQPASPFRDRVTIG